MGADDQPGPDDQGTFVEDVLDSLLAERLQRAVVREVRRKLVDWSIAELGDGVPLRRRDGEVGVDRDARHEEVAARVTQQLGGVPHDARHVAGGVDDCIPPPSIERLEACVPVPTHSLRLREELGVRLAAREERQLVPASQRGVRDGAPQELRPPENQELQWNLCTARQTASAPNSTASTGIRSSAAWISFMKSKPSGSRIGRKP